MSVEYIKRITVDTKGRGGREKGVYITTKSNNDDCPYHTCRIKGLSDVYEQGGQRALDKEIFNMLYNYCVIKGEDKSVIRYKNIVYNCVPAETLYAKMVCEINDIYEKYFVHGDSKLEDNKEKYDKESSVIKDKFYSDLVDLLYENENRKGEN